MRILYTNFHLGWGGQPAQVLQLARAMQARGHDVTVFSPPESELSARAAAAGVPAETRCRFPRGFRPGHASSDLQILRAEMRGGAEVVHCHGSQDTWVSTVARLGLLSPPVLVRTKHNSYPPDRHVANRWLYKRGLDHIVAVAGPIRDELLRDGLVPPERVSVIPAGLDDDFGRGVEPDRAGVREEFGLAPETPLIGVVGRLDPDKGQDVFLAALGRVLAAVPQAHALLIGTGGDWDRIRGIITERDLADAVTWTGFREDVARLTAALDLSVLPARDCDASSTTVKEALRLGVPVVASDVGGTAEILDHGACGLLVPPAEPEPLAEAILAVLREPEAAAARAAAGQEHVQQYLASHVAEETEALYGRLREAKA